MAAFEKRPLRKVNRSLLDAQESTRRAERVVWLLGAGFSKPLGGPLFSELISDQSERWTKSWLTVRGFAPESPSNVLGIFKRGQQAKLWENAEDCLSLIDEARSDQVAALVIRQALGTVVDDIETVWKRITQFVTSATAHFVDRAFASTQLPEVWTPYERWTELLSEQDSVVSFNYDLVVESLLTKMDKKISLAKLHGSVPETRSFREHILGGKAILTIATPGPGKTKSRDNPIVAEAWTKAEQDLQRADRLVVIGYSFPSSDAYVRSFVLSKCKAQSVDVVVGQDPCGKDIADMFARSPDIGAAKNTGLTAQQYLAEGTAQPYKGRFNH